MRNLKRALSLALASVMLLGMMVIGTSAASNFTDADEIVNTEAAAITGGLGIFAGANGEFMPEKAVTRAEMATIIVKMLYGNNYNANPFKGIDKFSDVADYQGGWAEGYINLCTSLKIFGGYGDGTFKPGQTVTTAEAASMILSALGLNKNLGEWPLGVMTKATEIKMFGDLKLTADTKLTRDNLSVLVLNGLKYTPNGGTVYVVTKSGVDYEFDNLKDAALYAAVLGAAAPTKVETIEGSLADTVYGMKTATGVVTANSATSTNAAISTIGGTNFSVETGLDVLGHKVTVYYKDADKSDSYTAKETVYSVVDNSKTVTVSKSSNTEADWNKIFGSDVSFVANGSLVTIAANGTVATDGNGTANTVVANHTYVVADKKVVADIAPLTVSFDKVEKVDNTKDAQTIKFAVAGTLNNGKLIDGTATDVVREYEGIADNDYVTLVKLGAIYTVSKTTKVTGTVSEVGKDNAYVILDGVKYSKATVTNSVTGMGISTPATKDDFTKKSYSLYLDENGKFLTCVVETGSNVSSTDPVYVIAAYKVTVPAEIDEYGQTISGTGVNKFYVQCVNMAGEIVSYRVADDQVTGSGTTGDPYTNENIGKLVTVGAPAASTGIVELTAVSSAAAANTKAVAKNVSDTALTKTEKSVATTSGEGKIYLADAQKVIYVNKKADLSKTTATVTTGKVAIDNSTPYVIYGTKADSTDKNYTAQYIVVDAALPTVEDGTGIMYVKSGTNYTSIKGGNYVLKVYVDGVATEITVGASSITDSATTAKYTGFVTYTIDSKTGVYTLTGTAAAEKGKSGVVGNIYNNYITIGSDTDLDASNAVIVDLATQSGNAKISTLAGLKGCTVSYYLPKAGTVSYIYVTGLAS